MNRLELEPILQDIRKESRAVLIELYGKSAQTWDDYFARIKSLLRFPSPCDENVNRYLDWIRDLTWFDDVFYRERYALVVYEFSSMFSGDVEMKNEFEREFVEIILP